MAVDYYQCRETASQEGLSRLVSVIATFPKILNHSHLLLRRRERLRVMRQLSHWESIARYERGLWPASGSWKWRLGETEGPYRIRYALLRSLKFSGAGS